MTVADLVRELERVGVRLWEDTGQVRFRAPHGIMTEERIVALRAAKDDVLAYVRAERGERTLTCDPASRLTPFPVTDVQAAYLLGRRDAFDFGGVACHGYGELAFAALEPEDVERAWQAIVARHDMLRAVVELDGSQRVLASVPPYRVAVADMRGRDDDAVAATLADVRAAMDHRCYEPSQWPLFELRMTRTDAGDLLHLSIDFLIADFVSIRLLLDELARRCANLALELPTLEPTFRDYVLAERRLREGAGHERDRAYWLDRLESLPPPPELPLRDDARDAPRRFDRHELTLEPARWTALRARAGAHGVTPSGAVLAAYAEVVRGWSRRGDFTLDLTLLNRRPLHPQVDELVGDFTSVELLAVPDAPGAAFGERAAALQAQLFEDLDHRLFTGVELMREIARRDGPGAALFPIVYTSAVGLATPPGEQSGVELGELGYGISQTPQVWIDCQVSERAGALALNWDVRRGIFPAGMVEDMFATFEDLLGRLADDDAAWTSPAPAPPLPPSHAERRRAVNANAASLPEALLHEGAVAHALRASGDVAVVDRDGATTYGELLGEARAVAAALRDGGTVPGDRVAVTLDKSASQIAAVLGVLLAGAAYVPIDASQPPLRRDRMLELAGVRHVLTATPPEQPWPAGVAAIPVAGLAPVAPAHEHTPRAAAPDDLAYVIFTSGSTGMPKGVMVSHRAAQNTIEDVSARFGVGAGDRVLGLAALGFDLSVYDVFGTLALGATLVLPDPQRRADPAHWCDLVERHGVTVWNSVPAQLQMLADYLRGVPDRTLDTLRLALLSGDWIPVALPDEIRARLSDLALVSLGGATEAAIWSIYHEIGEVPPDWHSIPYGRPLANQAFHVLDGAMRPRPEWVTGELYIAGAGLALGYAGDEQETAARFVSHPVTGERLYRTGDLGRYLPDGTIEFLGREDFQVKIRGHRIELAEVEAALASHPLACAAAVVVAGDTPLERSLVAFVEPASVPDTPADDAVGEAVRWAGAELLAGADLPRYLAYAHELNRVALLTMLATLRGVGLFADTGATHALDEILARLRPAPGQVRLVRRWLRALVENGMLAHDAGDYRCPVALADGALEPAWERAEELGREVDAGASELLAYFRRSAEHLTALLRGDRDPLELLFPEGRIDIADALYRQAFVNRYSTAMLAAGAAAAAAQRPGGSPPLRVLEVGAGIGGATLDVVAALPEHEYLFTDLSRFFLNIARDRLAHEPQVSFAVYDLDADARPQGLRHNTFDLVLASDVLHSTRNVGETFARLRELVAPGGWLLFVEMTRDQYQIMASLELLTRVAEDVGDFTDARRGRDQTFLERDAWLEALGAAGAQDVLVAPAPDDPAAELGIVLFGARLKSDRAALRADELREHAARRLPEHMLPAQIEIVDALPLTANAKLDHATLRSWVAAPACAPLPAAGAAPQTDLERRIAAVWAQMFGVESVERDRSFFDLGGDSLLSAQVAGHLREDVPEAATMFFDDLLRALLGGTTVAELAATIERGGSAAAPTPVSAAASPLVRLDDGLEGTPRVLVHGADGSLAAYAAIVGELAERGPLLGLRATADEDGPDDPAARSRRAAEYGRALLAEGHLALHLVGFDDGALLALEIARHLLESGAEVQTLTVMGAALVDGALPDPYLGDVRLLQRTADPAPLRDRVEQLWRACCLGELEVVAPPSGGPDADDAALLAALTATAATP